jgi:arylsulfatase A-like enzyme
MTNFQLTAVAAAAQSLMSTPDPAETGSILDNTVIVFIGDNGQQHHSTASEFPVVLIGAKNLGRHTGGRTIVDPGVDSGGANHRQVSNLWNTFGHLAGQSLDTFGGEGAFRVAPGPLSELMA